jgi:hypothetical protein
MSAGVTPIYMSAQGLCTALQYGLQYLAVQWLNEVLCFVSSLVLADSFRLRNRQLLVAVKRYMPF